MDILQKCLKVNEILNGKEHLSYVDNLLYINQIYLKKRNTEKCLETLELIDDLLKNRENEGGNYLPSIVKKYRNKT